MTRYGEDETPDLNLATELAWFDKVLPLNNSRITQWSYGGGKVVRMISNRQGKSKLRVKFQE